MDKEFFMNRLRELGYVGPTSFIDALIQEAAAEQVRKDAEIANEVRLRERSYFEGDLKKKAMNNAEVGTANEIYYTILKQLRPTKTEGK